MSTRWRKPPVISLEVIIDGHKFRNDIWKNDDHIVEYFIDEQEVDQNDFRTAIMLLKGKDK